MIENVVEKETASTIADSAAPIAVTQADESAGKNDADNGKVGEMTIRDFKAAVKQVVGDAVKQVVEKVEDETNKNCRLVPLVQRLEANAGYVSEIGDGATSTDTFFY